MSTNERPLVSIVTLNYNQAKVTREFLESTRLLTYPNLEVIVCDMDSLEDPRKLIDPSQYQNTRLLLAGKNLGFAGGNNWGIAQAKGDYIFIVNNDTEVTPDLIEQLLLPFYKEENIAVTCPKIKFFDHPAIIQYAGFNRMNTITGRTSTIGEGEEDKGQHDQPGPTFGAHGCAMMVKREIIDKLGIFPEKFFLYYEEWDWSARIRKAGHTIWYQPSAVIYHKESTSVGKQSPLKTYYQTRNRILYMRRNSNWGKLFLFTLFFTFFALPKGIVTFTARRQFPQLKSFLKGIAWNLRNSHRSRIRWESFEN